MECVADGDGAALFRSIYPDHDIRVKQRDPEADYFAGRKAEYRREKEPMAAVLIQKAEEALLPGLARAWEG